MSNLSLSPSEIRLATATLACIAALLPTIYLLRSSNKPPRDSTPHMRTFRKFIAAYPTLRPQALAAHASADFTHTVLPSSLNLPSRGLEPFQQHAAMIFSLFSDFSMVPQPEGSPRAVHFCADTGTVVAHCRMGGRVDTASEKGRVLVEGGVLEWWTECVLFVRMSGDGGSVVEVREFVDSGRAGELKGRLSGVLG
ncbi:hypothetical protein BU26DRAFT_584611 [Trematosphaeria pertusa]|uniref:SnoaL-like domain-containing protein n=1 Tax=Trematosphaeria pertusa TaxID=390896 RepID=A0A6A6HWA5_9PLEO|nr:uncharacterized protein BU26DRAFT_584611 [Trematosphaeria pertusa]KAF2242366.1 hypothetical protein BU26DRAFT_584611 [Trematosphaeria pertusa]